MADMWRTKKEMADLIGKSVRTVERLMKQGHFEIQRRKGPHGEEVVLRIVPVVESAGQSTAEPGLATNTQVAAISPSPKPPAPPPPVQPTTVKDQAPTVDEKRVPARQAESPASDGRMPSNPTPAAQPFSPSKPASEIRAVSTVTVTPATRASPVSATIVRPVVAPSTPAPTAPTMPAKPVAITPAAQPVSLEAMIVLRDKHLAQGEVELARFYDGCIADLAESMPVESAPVESKTDPVVVTPVSVQSGSAPAQSLPPAPKPSTRCVAVQGIMEPVASAVRREIENAGFVVRADAADAIAMVCDPDSITTSNVNVPVVVCSWLKDTGSMRQVLAKPNVIGFVGLPLNERERATLRALLTNPSRKGA